MRINTLVTLVVVLAVVIGVWAFVVMWGDDRAPIPSEPLGKLLLKGVAWDRVVIIEIIGPESQVIISKTKTHWGVNEREGYPANISKLRRLFSSLKDLKIGRRFQGTESVLARLKLKAPGSDDANVHQQATKLVFKDGEGKVMVDLLFGKVWQGGGEKGFPSGQYVRFGNKEMVYLVDKHFPNIETNPVAWLDKVILSINEREIKEIKAYSEGGKRVLYALVKKGKKDDFRPTGPLRDQVLDKAKLNTLARALANLRLEDVLLPSVRPESVGIDRDEWIEFHLFDGKVYRIFVSERSRETKGEQGKTEPKYYIIFETRDNSGKLVPGPKIGRIFQVSQWTHKAFVLDPQKLVQPKKGKDGKREPDKGA